MMNVSLRKGVLVVPIVCIAAACILASDVRKVDRLPALDVEATAGLVMQVKPTKPTYKVGEQVRIMCTITNKSDSIKPLAWWDKGLHFTCLKGGKDARIGGLLPASYPEIPEPILIRSKPNLPRPGYILYLPAKQSLTFRLTHKAAQPEKFRGVVCYDPLAPRAWPDQESQKRSQLFSEMLEYEMVE